MSDHFIVDEAQSYEAMRGLREVASGVGLGRNKSADIQRYVNCIRDHITPHLFYFRKMPDWKFPEDAIGENRWSA